MLWDSRSDCDQNPCSSHCLTRHSLSQPVLRGKRPFYKNPFQEFLGGPGVGTWHLLDPCCLISGWQTEILKAMRHSETQQTNKTSSYVGGVGGKTKLLKPGLGRDGYGVTGPSAATAIYSAVLRLLLAQREKLANKSQPQPM